MLTRNRPSRRGNDRTIMQDGFSAPVESAPRQRFFLSLRDGRAARDGFSDNGDGTLTAVRCVDRQADDLDIQFEAGACPVGSHRAARVRGMRCAAPGHPAGEPAADRRNGVFRLLASASADHPRRGAARGHAGLRQMQPARTGAHRAGRRAAWPSCFSKCAALKRVEMPASVTQIGGGAFFGCSKELRLYGAEEAPAAQYARLNGLTFDFQSWKDDESSCSARRGTAR